MPCLRIADQDGIGEIRLADLGQIGAADQRDFARFERGDGELQRTRHRHTGGTHVAPLDLHGDGRMQAVAQFENGGTNTAGVPAHPHGRTGQCPRAPASIGRRRLDSGIFADGFGLGIGADHDMLARGLARSVAGRSDAQGQ